MYKSVMGLSAMCALMISVIGSAQAYELREGTNQAAFLIGQDVFVAGSTLDDTDLAREGDTYSAADSVVVNTPLGGNLTAATGTLHVTADVAGSVRTMASNVNISGAIGGYMIAAAQFVELSGTIGSDAVIYAQSVTIDANIAGDARIVAEDLTLNGVIGGNASIRAKNITLGENASIQGNGTVVYHSGEIPEGLIAGEADIREFVESPDNAAESLWGLMYVVGGFVMSLLLGALALWLIPHYIRSVQEGARRSYFANTGIGFGLMIIIPIVAVLLMVTLILIPVSGLMLLVYLALLIIAKILMGHVVGGLIYPPKIDQTYWQGLVILLIGLLALAVIELVLPTAMSIVLGVILFSLSFGSVVLNHIDLVKHLKQKHYL